MTELKVQSPEFSAKVIKGLHEQGITTPIKNVWGRTASELAGLHFASLPKFIEVEFEGKEERLYLFNKGTISYPTEELTKLGDYMALKEGMFLKEVIPAINEFIFKTAG